MGDHYNTLGLSRNASKEEIKDAFRKSALKFHPDRHSQSTNEVREGASLKFKQASEAYEVLIDDRKRADYDLGRGRNGRSGGFGYGNGYSSSSSSSSSSSYGGRSGGGGGGGRGFGYGGGSSSGYYRPPPIFDVAFIFRYVTRRGFLLNVAFASVLLGGAVVLEKSAEALWKMNNSGKSFEDAMQSIEKGKTNKDEN